jgi:hypothetical protein
VRAITHQGGPVIEIDQAYGDTHEIIDARIENCRTALEWVDHILWVHRFKGGDKMDPSVELKLASGAVQTAHKKRILEMNRWRFRNLKPMMNLARRQECVRACKRAARSVPDSQPVLLRLTARRQLANKLT